MSNESSNTHSFIDYAHATQVMKDFPPMIEIFEKLLPALYDKRHYTAVSDVIETVEESKLLMETQLDYYRKIYNQKGRMKSNGE